MKPGLGESNLGALAGAVVGSIGGLFVPGVVRVMVLGSPGEFFATPIVGVIFFLISGLLGWLAGGQIGPRLAAKAPKPSVEIAGGVLGGLIPVILLAIWAWQMTARPA